MESEQFQHQASRNCQQQVTDSSRLKRPRSYLSPPYHQNGESQQRSQAANTSSSHSSEKKKIDFPPLIATFKGPQQATIRELADELISNWKNQHGIDLSITARFGHMHSFLVFANDSPTFESLLDPIRWPDSLKGVEMSVKSPRQLPAEYSLIIQQFHRNWNEEEILLELKQNYASLVKLTRMKVKDGSPLNAVRADFRSRDEVTSVLRLGKIKVGSMVQPVKQYHLPIRINKCMKCLQHDHTTNTCTRRRLCPRCAEEHSLEKGCSNKEKCANCGGDHYSGHSACPIVQDRRRVLLDQAQRTKAELLVEVEQRLHQQNNGSRQDPSVLIDGNLPEPYSRVVNHPRDQPLQRNIELTLNAFLAKMERRLEDFSSRITSQLCEIEKKVNVYADRQQKQDKIINEIILPSIQALHHAISRTPNKNKSQNDLPKLLEDINRIVTEYSQQPDTHIQQTSPEHFNTSVINVSH